MYPYEKWMEYQKNKFDSSSELVDDAPQWAIEARERFLELLEKADDLTDY